MSALNYATNFVLSCLFTHYCSNENCKYIVSIVTSDV